MPPIDYCTFKGRGGGGGGGVGPRKLRPRIVCHLIIKSALNTTRSLLPLTTIFQFRKNIILLCVNVRQRFRMLCPFRLKILCKKITRGVSRVTYSQVSRLKCKCFSCRLSLLLVLVLAPRVFFPGYSGFSSLLKN